MPAGFSGLQRLPPKALQVGFWAAFAAVAIAAFVGASATGYRYGADLAATTYGALLQGFGILAAAAALGLVLRKHMLDVEIRRVEGRTLEALAEDLGWQGLRWSEELEERILALPPTVAVAAPATPAYAPAAPVAPAPPVEPPPPAPVVTAEEPASLDEELDSLLDAIMEEDQKPGAAARAVEAEAAELEQLQVVAPAPAPPPPAPPAPATEVRSDVYGAAVAERRRLVALRRELYTVFSGPLAQMGALAALGYWALPQATGLLAQDVLLNTTLLFLMSYGAVVALANAALSALRAAAA